MADELPDELAVLLRKLKTIYITMGGASSEKEPPPPATGQELVENHRTRIEQLQQAYDAAPPDSVHAVRLRQKLRDAKAALKRDRAKLRAATKPGSVDLPVVGARAQPERVTREQLQAIADIHEEGKIQDTYLDQMSNVLVEVQHAANTAKDEVERSIAVLDGLDRKTAVANAAVEAAATGAARLVQLNSKSSRVCMYLVCTVILFSLCLLLYNMWRGN
jgi:hypothetical protein